MSANHASYLVVALTSLAALAQTATAAGTDEDVADSDPAAPLAATSPLSDSDAATLRGRYDTALDAWKEAIRAIENLRIEFQAEGDPDAQDSLREQLAAAIAAARPKVDQFSAAALALLAQGGELPRGLVDALRAMARYYVLGDTHGDGGDQFEQALPIAAALIEHGATDGSILLIAGIAAASVNDFDLAERYFGLAANRGELGDAPPAFDQEDPRVRLWNTARQYSDDLAKLRQYWEEERKLRDAESEADDLPRVRLVTSEGEIVFELFENEAPQAVANFLHLVKQGYYDGLLFHRVLAGFMAQGGDNERGGPGYTIRCECYEDGYRRHFRGSLSMAKPSFPPRDSGSGQFFITLVPTSHLDGKHTVFGRVIDGMEVAAALKRRDPQSISPHAPDAPDRIIRAEVVRDRGHDYPFEKITEGSR